MFSGVRLCWAQLEDLGHPRACGKESLCFHHSLSSFPQADPAASILVHHTRPVFAAVGSLGSQTIHLVDKAEEGRADGPQKDWEDCCG